MQPLNFLRRIDRTAEPIMITHACVTKRGGWRSTSPSCRSCSKIGELADRGVAFLNVPLVTC
jgi:hypothetical protein